MECSVTIKIFTMSSKHHTGYVSTKLDPLRGCRRSLSYACDHVKRQRMHENRVFGHTPFADHSKVQGKLKKKLGPEFLRYLSLPFVVLV